MSSQWLTSEQSFQFHAEGYLIVRQLFDQEEMELLTRVAKSDRDLDRAKRNLDADGRVTRIWLRNELHDDIYSAFVSCHRLVDAMDQLLGEEVYHFHHKITLKDAGGGGAWEWHQDFGYWYENSFCLFPDMGSCVIAIDRATRENGCLQLMQGSHRCGRLETRLAGSQTGTDPERIAALLDRQELVFAELDPGDVLFFHSNTLHRSDENNSDQRRWSLICCYNTKHNSPYKQGGHPSYKRLERWPDAKIKQIGRRQLREQESGLEGKQ